MNRHRRVIILSHIDDIHAAAAAWGLQQLNCEVYIWHWFDYLDERPCSLHLSEDGKLKNSVQSELFSVQGPFDAVWCRRRYRVKLPKNVSEPDERFVIREATAYLNNAVRLLGSADTLWMNPPDAAMSADNKMVQLMAAQSVGFEVPETLFSNDYLEIKAFFSKHDEKIIYKPFTPAVWLKKGVSSSSLATTALTSEHLQDSESIEICPGIYQPLISKSYELRVNVIGSDVFAVAIHSQRKKESVDWRFDFSMDQLEIELIELPMEIRGRCVELCKTMKLNFAAVDIIVTPDGRYVFLEVNEEGQFLWIEMLDKKIPLLNSVCRTLAGDAPIGEPQLLFSDFLNSEAYRKWQKKRDRPVSDLDAIGLIGSYE